MCSPLPKGRSLASARASSHGSAAPCPGPVAPGVLPLERLDPCPGQGLRPQAVARAAALRSALQPEEGRHLGSAPHLAKGMGGEWAERVERE